MIQNSTIAAIATPPGQGGIAVIRLSGPESYRVAEQVFRPMPPEGGRGQRLYRHVRALCGRRGTL